MYISIKSCIVYNDNKSDLFSSKVGVRQSEKLVTFLFAVFLNDLEQFMEEKNIRGLKSISSELEAQLEIYLKMFALLYADDTVLMSEIANGLQTLLNIFYEYSKFWKLKVNIDKTKIMVFPRVELQNMYTVCQFPCFVIFVSCYYFSGVIIPPLIDMLSLCHCIQI